MWILQHKAYPAYAGDDVGDGALDAWQYLGEIIEAVTVLIKNPAAGPLLLNLTPISWKHCDWILASDVGELGRLWPLGVTNPPTHQHYHMNKLGLVKDFTHQVKRDLCKASWLAFEIVSRWRNEKWQHWSLIALQANPLNSRSLIIKL